MNYFSAFAKSSAIRKKIAYFLLYMLDFFVRGLVAIVLLSFLFIESMIFIGNSTISLKDKSIFFYAMIALFFLLLFIIILPLEKQNFLQKLVMGHSAVNIDKCSKELSLLYSQMIQGSKQDKNFTTDKCERHQ